MTSSRSIRILASGLLTALGLSACGGDNGPAAPTVPPTFSDPAATKASLAAFDSTFDAPVIQSFGSQSDVIVVPTAAALQPLHALLAATRVIPVPGETPSELRVSRLQALRQLRPLLGTAGPIIPDSYYGAVWAWDCETGSYFQQSSTGGPETGIRFLLYALDPFTGQIACPSPTQVGHVDLTDLSDGAADRLRVQVVSGSVTYLAYTISITGTETSVSIAVTGTLRNGAPAAPGTKTVTFTIDVDATLGPTGDARLVYSTTFQLDRPLLTFAFTETSDYDADTGVLTGTLDLRMTRPGESVQIVYTLVIDDVHLTLTGEVRINDQRFATVEGDILFPTFRDTNGQVVESGPVFEALRALGTAVLAFDYLLYQVFAPLGTSAP